MKRALVGILALGLIIGSIGSSVGMGQKPETEETMEANEEATKQYLAEEEKEREKIKEKLPELIEELKTAKGYRRFRIIHLLSRSRDTRAVEPIGEIMLTSEDRRERSWAADRLAQMGHKDSIPFFKRALEDDFIGIRSTAAIALYRLGEVTLALPIMEEIVKQGYAGPLGAFSHVTKDGKLVYDENAKPFFMKALNYANEEVRLNVAGGLADMGEKELAYPIAVKALKNGKNSREKSMAIWVLSKIGNEDAIYLIADMLNDEDALVRQDAERALIELGRDDLIKGKSKIKK